MINLIVWLLLGALVGWLASMVMRTDAQQGAILEHRGRYHRRDDRRLSAWWPDDQRQRSQSDRVGCLVHRCSDLAGDCQSGTARQGALALP